MATPDPIETVGYRNPHVGVFERLSSGDDSAAPTSATATAPLILTLAQTGETLQTLIEIRTPSDDRLVTAIELLSPSNKRGGGAAEFQRKRQELPRSPAHYLEIDLLRIGERFPMTTLLPSAPYFVFLSRQERRPLVEVWPISLDAALPNVPIPLLSGDPDAQLDLGLAFRTVYELYEYDRDIDYSVSPVVELNLDQQAWAADRLRNAGRR